MRTKEVRTLRLRTRKSLPLEARLLLLLIGVIVWASHCVTSLLEEKLSAKQTDEVNVRLLHTSSVTACHLLLKEKA